MRIEITDEYLYCVMPKVAKKMMDDIPENPPMPFEPSKQFEKRMKKLMHKSRQLENTILKRRHSMRKVASWAIAFVAVGLVLAATVQANEELRMKIKESIVMDDSIMEYFDVNGEAKIKHLTDVPLGYELICENPTVYYAEYQNADGSRIILDAWPIDNSTAILKDTDFIESNTYIVNGTEVLVGYKDNGMIVANWYDDNVFYLLSVDDLSEEEIVAMVKSIK